MALSTEEMIALGIVGAVAVYSLRKPITDLTTPVGGILESGADLVQHTVKGAETLGDAYVGFVKNVSELPQNVNEFLKEQSKPPKIVKTPLPVSVSSSNTIFTNPISKVQKGVDLTSAQQMIDISKNPKIQNIATNIKQTGTTVYTPKTVQLSPKKEFGGLLI